ncbi:MAG: aldo/keto reductase [Myxococcaceae bacterium]|nr:aldo/keto reductase [Myxococcaceae bacterium]
MPSTLTIAGSPTPIARVIVGTAAMGSVLPDAWVSKTTRENELRFLDACFEMGCTAFDTAAIYQAGGTERLLGAWFASRQHRERVFLITKGAHPNPVLGTSHFSAADVEKDLHASLRRLGTDYVDLYLLHRDDPSRPFEPVLEALARFQREGKIRAYGVSNWRTERIRAAQQYAAGHGLPSIAASSPHFSLFEWTRPPWPGTVTLTGAANAEARAWHARTQLPVLAWSPLGHGFLADPPSAHGRKYYGTAENEGRKARARELAKQKGVTTGDIALAYLFHQPFPVAAVVASSKPERMKRNLAAAELSLSPGEIAFLEGTR